MFLKEIVIIAELLNRYFIGVESGFPGPLTPGIFRGEQE